MNGVFIDRAYVLIDDVCTTSGHFRACAVKLQEAGAQVIVALCAGRTMHDQSCEPFEVPVEFIEDYSP